MNKKQLIIAWVVGITTSITFLFYPKKYFICYGNSQFFFDSHRSNTLPVIQWAYIIPIFLSILVVGGLLIYTLRDKKLNIESQEPDRKKKVKKIIAREMLIMISLIMLNSFIAVTPTPYKCVKNIKHPINKEIEKKYGIFDEETKNKYIVIVNKEIDIEKLSTEEIQQIVGDDSKVIRKDAPLNMNKRLIISLVFLIYPFYWVIRFIIWTIKTVRQK